MSPTIDMKTIIKAALLSTFALYRLAVPFGTAPQPACFLAFTIPLSLIAAHSAINPSNYYKCMQARRHALGLTLEQHYNSGLWLTDDQRCSQ